MELQPLLLNGYPVLASMVQRYGENILLIHLSLTFQDSQGFSSEGVSMANQNPYVNLKETEEISKADNSRHTWMSRLYVVSTLEYWINVQQILFKFWVLAHLHAYFVLHNSTEKNVVQNLFFTTYLLPTRLFGLHVYSVP